MSEFKRYTISGLAREVGISRTILYYWIEKGYLKPSCNTGSRNLYSLKSFIDAEKQSLKGDVQVRSGKDKVPPFIYNFN